ncbi:MAG TPA: hypothetical protein VHU42_00825 [Rhodopila sp.]|nr:hypothetical protein [Rhodopila sp.]
MPTLVADNRVVALQFLGGGDRPDQACRQRRRRLTVSAFHDDRKFIAAEARDQIAVAHTTAQARSDEAEKFVTGGVAKRVVDLLEAIEINAEDGERVVFRLFGGQRVHPVEKHFSTRQAGLD